jgi:Pyruvate/2-oxoacid:ferredoxin oxidoreductase delta subunit
VRALTQEEAHAILRRAASAGLVHSVSNSRDGLSYICNCCTCSCGILRGLSDLGMADVIASSPFINTLNPERCVICEACLPYCQFHALVLEDGRMQVNGLRCVGCGVCVPACPEDALSLVRRPTSQATYIPGDFEEWSALRLTARGRQ